MKTKDFQEATAKQICSQFKVGQKRILLADEVGLGKTIIASAVVKMVSEWHKEAGDDYFKVVYICSNINIANQNARKLGIPNDDCVKIYESRLSMQHLITQENENKDHAYYQLIPMTPSTSFTMTGGQGTQQERALIFAIMTHCSEWRKHERELEQLLKFDPRLKGWEHYKIEYCNRITECNDSSGNIYLTEMESALERYLDKDPELRTELRSICQAQDIFAIQEKERRFVINKLRRIFAQISLDRLEADLVIMDEFQRFKDLIAPEDRDDESSMLSRHFLGNRDMKVLLLSATPYKPYSTLEELAENGDESYQEFLQVMEFLADGPEQQRKFREVWSDYSVGLAELTAGELTVLKTQKQKAEDELYQYVCRTERRSDSIIDSSKASRGNLKEEIESLSPGDILSYIELQQLMEALGLGRFPVEYVKSAPYLLSFMNYKVKDSIVAQLQKTEDYTLVEKSSTMLLRKRQINRYDEIPCNNSRLQSLYREAFGQENRGAELLLWIPASKPYYCVENVFSQNAGYSKILVFSSWEMVPRMIAAMASYEAERRVVERLSDDWDIRYFKQMGDDPEMEGKSSSRAGGISRLLREERRDILCYPSHTLARLYDPMKYMGHTLAELRTEVKSQLRSKLQACHRSGEKMSAGQILALLQNLDRNDDSNELYEISEEVEDFLVNLAIGSPAVCALRVFGHEDKKSDEYAEAIAECFVALFNKPETRAVIRAMYETEVEDAFYYERVVQYCMEGNLQAVMDEYAYTLNYSGEELAAQMKAGFIQTTTLPVESRESFRGRGKPMRMRTHFAVGYYSTKTDDKTVQRAENIRGAFNSPFRPFVLATTSIGQEGLDFHSYSRKIMHWNLPSNPIDLEQREGRINRYLCHAIRQNLAESEYGNGNFEKDFWAELLDRASKALKGAHSDMVPFWCLPDDFPYTRKIERIVPMFPFSKEKGKYARLLDVLSAYRLTLGQPRQEELLESLSSKEISADDWEDLYMDLSPWNRTRKCPAHVEVACAACTCCAKESKKHDCG